MKTELKQVVVVGAGPSGSTVSALLKSRGIDVVVLEKATFPRFSIGESLLPACMEVVEQAGMTHAVSSLVSSIKMVLHFVVMAYTPSSTLQTNTHQDRARRFRFNVPTLIKYWQIALKSKA